MFCLWPKNMNIYCVGSFSFLKLFLVFVWIIKLFVSSSGEVILFETNLTLSDQFSLTFVVEFDTQTNVVD